MSAAPPSDPACSGQNFSAQQVGNWLAEARKSAESMLAGKKISGDSLLRLNIESLHAAIFRMHILSLGTKEKVMVRTRELQLISRALSELAKAQKYQQEIAHENLAYKAARSTKRNSCYQSLKKARRIMGFPDSAEDFGRKEKDSS